MNAQEIRVASLKQISVDLFKGGAAFRTPVSPLPYGTGEIMCQAFYRRCVQCGQERYIVKSHSTELYIGSCQCANAYCNVQWYSKSTSNLQDMLAQAFSDYHDAFYADGVQIMRKAHALALYRARRDYVESGQVRRWEVMSQEQRLIASECHRS